jgi:hypothetical protein
MTKDQAIAILQAERALQYSEGDSTVGPDYVQGTAWYELVREAWEAIAGDWRLCCEFGNLALVKTIQLHDATPIPLPIIRGNKDETGSTTEKQRR